MSLDLGKDTDQWKRINSPKTKDIYIGIKGTFEIRENDG